MATLKASDRLTFDRVMVDQIRAILLLDPLYGAVTSQGEDFGYPQFADSKYDSNGNRGQSRGDAGTAEKEFWDPPCRTIEL